MKISKIAALCLVNSALFFSGCGTDNSSNNSTSSTSVSGTAVDETIANGIVEIHKNNPTGTILTQGRTDENGNYNLNLDYKGPIVISVSCDENSSFVEDNGSKIKCNLTNPLLSVTIADGTDIKGNVSPITTQLAKLALENGDLTAESLQKAKKVIAYIYGIDPVILNPKTNSSYKSIIDTIHKVAKDNNKSVEDVTNDLINDSKDGIFGDSAITKSILNNLEGKIKSSALDNNDTEINIDTIENSNIAYDKIAITQSVITSLRDNLYSISNKDNNTSIDKEVDAFNTAINRDVIKDTENQLDAFGYILNAAVDSNAKMNGSVNKNGMEYNYNITANSNNTEFNYTISWNNKDYKGTIKTSQDYKALKSPDDLNNDMSLDVNGDLPSTDNKTIYAKVTAHKNDDNTFNFDLSNVEIKGDKDSLQIQNVTIDGKYFTFTDSNEDKSQDLNYIKFNNIEINSKIDNRFEINGTLSLNWIQNNYINNKYPQGNFSEVYWLQTNVTCENENGNQKAPTGGYVIFDVNGKDYILKQSWNNNTEMGFEINDPDEDGLMMSSKDGNLEEYVENKDNYILDNVTCESGYTPKIEEINKDMGDDFANEGYIPNKITFTGDIKDITTNIELNGKLEVSSNDIQKVDLTKEDIVPYIDTTLNIVLTRPEYADTILNAELKYNNDKSSNLNMSYNYGDDTITIVSTWNSDQSGSTTITDVNGVKIVLPVNTDGNIIFDKTSIIYQGETIGKIEDRGEDLPVAHFNDGTTTSIY